MKMNVTATVSHALGHWPRILPALGIQVLKNRHQPCPVCGGSDRFRFDDREGRGTWYCNQCGAGDGLKLVEKVFGVSPSDAAAKVAAVTGSLPPADPAVTAAAVAETEAARKNAAALAQTLMAKTRPGTGNAYLTRKGFPGRECRMLTGTHRAGGVSWRAGDLVVPLYDDSGELVNLQLISADGRKRTLKGGQVRGTCHTLEGQNQAGKRLWIAEGYATALTVHHLTGETVMVALSSVNLLSLASLARQKHPACQIVLAADRDLSGDGQKKAAAAADACEGVVALPPVFGDPMLARSLLQSQQNSDEALNIKRDADPTFDFIGYLETLPQTSGMYMGNASIIPRNYRKYLYHAYLAYMEANGYRNVLSLKMFGLGLPVMLKEYGLNYEKRHTKQGIQTNLTLKEESYGDWLPKCDDPATT
ncbi:primase-helicase zinc-binding domain-containing protein [Escherichia coli]